MRVRSRRLLAGLAGGLVLAGGGVTTLAAWQDNEYDQVPVSLSKFDVEQTIDDSTWGSAETAGTAKVLTIAVDGVLSRPLTPGGAVTAWVGLRAGPESLGADVTMGAPTIGSDPKGIASSISYDVISGVTKDQCQAGSIPASGAVLVSNAALSAPQAAGFALTAGTSGAPGPAVGVCFRLRLAPTLPHSLGGAPITPTWQFSATSKVG